MTKYYRVAKDNFMWLEGAILSNEEEPGGYTSITDLWDKVELSTEYISSRIIEDPKNADCFERVYPIGKLEKMIFGNKDAAREEAAKLYKGTK